jgi:hypothetical protein
MKPKSSHLLCQHLENISRKALENYPDLIKDFVKNRHDITFRQITYEVKSS